MTEAASRGRNFDVKDAFDFARRTAQGERVERFVRGSASAHLTPPRAREEAPINSKTTHHRLHPTLARADNAQPKRKPFEGALRLEPLEERITPAVFALPAGVVTVIPFADVDGDVVDYTFDLTGSAAGTDVDLSNSATGTDIVFDPSGTLPTNFNMDLTTALNIVGGDGDYTITGITSGSGGADDLGSIAITEGLAGSADFDGTLTANDVSAFLVDDGIAGAVNLSGSLVGTLDADANFDALGDLAADVSIMDDLGFVSAVEIVGSIDVGTDGTGAITGGVATTWGGSIYGDHINAADGIADIYSDGFIDTAINADADGGGFGPLGGGPGTGVSTGADEIAGAIVAARIYDVVSATFISADITARDFGGGGADVDNIISGGAVGDDISGTVDIEGDLDLVDAGLGHITGDVDADAAVPGSPIVTFIDGGVRTAIDHVAGSFTSADIYRDGATGVIDMVMTGTDSSDTEIEIRTDDGTVPPGTDVPDLVAMGVISSTDSTAGGPNDGGLLRLFVEGNIEDLGPAGATAGISGPLSDGIGSIGWLYAEGYLADGEIGQTGSAASLDALELAGVTSGHAIYTDGTSLGSLLVHGSIGFIETIGHIFDVTTIDEDTTDAIAAGLGSISAGVNLGVFASPLLFDADGADNNPDHAGQAVDGGGAPFESDIGDSLGGDLLIRGPLGGNLDFDFGTSVQGVFATGNVNGAITTEDTVSEAASPGDYAFLTSVYAQLSILGDITIQGPILDSIVAGDPLGLTGGVGSIGTSSTPISIVSSPFDPVVDVQEAGDVGDSIGGVDGFRFGPDMVFAADDIFLESTLGSAGLIADDDIHADVVAMRGSITGAGGAGGLIQATGSSPGDITGLIWAGANITADIVAGDGDPTDGLGGGSILSDVILAGGWAVVEHELASFIVEPVAGNGIADSFASTFSGADDVQVIGVGSAAAPGDIIVSPGFDGVLDFGSFPLVDDVLTVLDNNTAATANPVNVGTGVTVRGVIDGGGGGDIDFFSFTAGAGDTIYIDVDAANLGSSLDPVITLYDTDGATILADNDDAFGEADSFLEYSGLAAGTYFISIEDFFGGDGPAYTYDMNLELASAPGGYISGDIIADTDVGDDVGAVDVDTDFGALFGIVVGQTSSRTQENTISVSAGDLIAADEGISGAIRAGDDVQSAIIAGFDSTISEGDDISGDILAGLDPAVTVGDIHGDIVANDDIIASTISSTNDIHGTGANTRLLIAALGASPGDITSDILAGDDIEEVDIDAGSGSGGSITGNIIAGTLDPNGDISDVTIEADQNIGIGGFPNTQAISASRDIETTSILAGLARDDGAIPDLGGFLSNPGLSGVGNIMVDISAGNVIGGGGGTVAGTSSDVVIAADGNIGEDSLAGADIDSISATNIGADNLASSLDVIINAGFGADGAGGDGYDRFGVFDSSAVGDATDQNIFSDIEAFGGSIEDVGILADDGIGRTVGGEGDSFILATDSILGTGDNISIIDAGNEDDPGGTILADIVAGYDSADPFAGAVATDSGAIAGVLISADDNIGEAAQASLDNGIILAAGDIANVRIQAGSGTHGIAPAVSLPGGLGAPGVRGNVWNSLGGNIYVNVVAGADGSGNIDPTIIEADDDIGAAPEGANVIFAGFDIGVSVSVFPLYDDAGAPYDVIIDAGNAIDPGGSINTDIIAFAGVIQDTLITADDNIGTTGQVLGAGAGGDQIDSDGLALGDDPQGIIQAGDDIFNVEIAAGEISINTATNAGFVGRGATVGPVITAGPDGEADSVAFPDDSQEIAPGTLGLDPDAIVVSSGANGLLDSPAIDDDGVTTILDGGSFLMSIIGGADGTGFIGANVTVSPVGPPDPQEGIVEDTFVLSADDDLGESLTAALPPDRRENNIISAADNISIWELTAGDNLDTFGMDTENTSSAGDLSIDIIAGTLAAPNNSQDGLGTTGVAGLPVGDNISDTTDTLTTHIPRLEDDDDNILVANLNIGLDDDGFELAPGFVADVPGTPDTLEGSGNFNATWAAASDLIVGAPVWVITGGVLSPAAVDGAGEIGGNVIGDDGRPPGGEAFIAGLGYTGGANALVLDLHVVGDWSAMVSAGTFAPLDIDLAPADGVVDIEAGTVTTLGTLAIALEAGRFVGSGAGIVGADGITIDEVLSGTEVLANGAFKPTSQFSATDDVLIQLRAHGRPLPGDTAPNPEDGDIIDLSILAFNDIANPPDFVEISKFDAPAYVPLGPIPGIPLGISATDQIDINYIMANVDAITSIDYDPAGVAIPDPGLPFNNAFGDLYIDIYSEGHGDDAHFPDGLPGESGITGGIITAGFDPFVLIDTTGGIPTNAPVDAVAQTAKVTSFLEAWGFGNIFSAEFRAEDVDPTNGLEVADISLELVAAGQDVDTLLVAQDDISFLDNTFHATLAANVSPEGSYIRGTEDSDIAAGLSAVGIPLGLDLSGFGGGGGPSFLFPGGNLNGDMVAGDDVFNADDPNLAISIAALGGFGVLDDPFDDTGNVNSFIVSGAEDQIAETILNPGGAPAAEANIWANITASGDVNVVNAGDIFAQFGGVTGGGLGGAPGTGRGSFFGTVTAGAGIDLLLGTADDQYDLDLSSLGNFADESGTIEAVVADTDIGAGRGLTAISATGDIFFIGAGFDGLGSDVMGDISTAADLIALIATGNIGAPGDLIAVAGNVGLIQAGNPTSSTGAALITDPNPRTGTIGVIGADIFVGGDVGDGLAGAGLLAADTNGDFVPDTLAVPISGDDNDGILAGLDITGSLFLGENTGIVDEFDVDPADLIIEEGGGIIHVFDITWTGTAVFEAAGDAAGTDFSGGGNFDVILVDPFDTTVGLDVTTNGTVGINELIVGDGFRGVNINQGSVDSILVSDDAADFARVTPVAPPALPPVVAGSLLALSVPESAFGDDVFQLDVVGPTTVSGNIGSFDVEGSLFDDITSTFGNIGNVTVGHDIDDVAITALEGSIGNITTLFGSIAPTSPVDVVAGAGVGNMEAAEGSIGEAATVSVQTTFGNVGSFTAEENIANLVVDVFAGSLAADTATDTTFVGANGVDGIPGNADDTHVAFYARTGSIDGLDITVGGGTPVGPGSLGIGFILAGQDIVDSSFVAQTNSIGDVFAGGDIVDSVFQANNGSVGVNPIFANFSIFGGVFIAKGPGPLGNVDTLIAHQGSISATLVQADNDSRGLYAYSNIGPGVTVNAGNDITGPLAIVQGFFNAVLGTHMGPEAFLAYNGSIGGVTANAHGNIGAIRASDDITGSSFTAETGDIATGTDAGIVGVVANWIQTDVGDISSSFVAGGDVGNIDAVGGSILAGALVRASGPIGIGNIDASENIDGAFTAETGSIGNVTSDAGDVTGSYTAGASVGNIDAEAGSILASITVDAVGSIGDIHASLDIDGHFTAQTADIGAITSDAGDIGGADSGAVFTAGNNIVSVTASAGSLLAGTSLTAGNDIGNITVFGDIVDGVTITAGNDIGAIDVGGNIEDGARVSAGRDIGPITVDGTLGADDEITPPPYPTIDDDFVDITAGRDIGPITVGINLTDGVSIVAGGSIGDISVGGVLGFDDDVLDPLGSNTFTQAIITAGASIGSVTAGSDIDEITLTAQGGSIGDVAATAGSITAAAVVHAQVDIGDVNASLDIDGEFTAEQGNIGVVTGVTSDAGDITGAFTAGISIVGVAAALGSVTGVFNAGGGGIGSVLAGDSITGGFTSSGPIGNVTANTGNISGRFSGAGIGDISASAGAITSSASFVSTLGIGNVFASADVDGAYDAQDGDIGNVTSDTGNIIATFTGVGSIGAIAARAGAIDATVEVSDSITSVAASGDIDGSLTAQTGDIGPILSDAGDIFADITAGGGIGPIDAALGGVFAGITAGAGGVAAVDAGTSVGGVITAQGAIGSITADTGGVLAVVTTGDSVGDVTAVAGAISALITADVNVGDLSASGNISGIITAQTGDIGAITSDAGSILADINAGQGIGAIDAVIGSVSASVTAGTDIAAVDAGANISGAITAGGNITGGLTADTGDVLATVTAGGSIGDINAVAGQISAQITADVNIGDVGASGSIRGALTAETGNIGDVTSDAGDILAEISAGLSIGAVDAVIGNVAGTITAGLNIAAVEAGADIRGVITAQTGTVGDVTADAGDITAAITAGVNIGNVTATTGAIGAAITADGSVGDVSASGNIGGTITAETGSIGSVTSDAGDLLADLNAGANIGDITIFDDIVDGSVDSEGIHYPGGVIAAGGDIGAIEVGDDVLDGVSITAGGNITSLTVDGRLGLDDEIEPPPTVPFSGPLPFDPDFVNIVAGGDIGPITVGEDITDGVSIFAGGSMGAIDVGGTIGLDDDPADPFDNNTFTQAVITAGLDIGAITAGGDIDEATITAQTGSIGNVTAAGGAITSSASLHAGASIGQVTASLDVTAPIVAETGDIAGISSAAGDIDTSATAGGTIGGVIAAGDIDGVYSSTDMDGFRSFTGDIGVNATATDSVGDLVADAGVIDSDVDAGDDLGDIIASGDLSGSYTAQAGNIGDVISIAGDITDIELTAGSDIDDIVAATGAINVTTVATAGGNISTIFASENIEGQFTSESGDIGASAYEAPSEDAALVLPAYPAIPTVVGTGIISEVGDINADFTAGRDVGNLLASTGDIRASITTGRDIGEIRAPIGTIDADLNANGRIALLSAQEIILTGLNAEDVDSITIDVDGVMTTLTTGGTPGILDVSLRDGDSDGDSEFVLKLTGTDATTALAVTTSDTSLVDVESIRGTDGSDIGSIDVEGNVDEINFVGDIAGRVDIRDGGDLGEVISFGDIGVVHVWNGTVGSVIADANVDGVGTIAEVRANEFLGVISGWIDPTQLTFTFNEGRAAVDSTLTVGGGGRAFIEVNNSVDVDLYDAGVTLTALYTDLDSVEAPAADTVGAITVNGGDLISADLAGSLGSVDVSQLAPTGGGEIISLSVVGNITGTVLADDGIGSINTDASIVGPTIDADADGDNIGDLGSAFAGNDINANVQAQNIGTISVRGDAGDVISGNITSVGDIDMIDSGEDGDVTGNVTAGRIRVDSPLFTIRDGGVIYNFDLVTGPGVASVAIAGNVGALSVNSIGFRGTDTTSVFELTTSDAVTGADSTILADVQDVTGSSEDFGSLTIEGNVNSVTNFDDIGALNVEGSLASAVAVAGDLGELNVGFNLSASVTAGGAIGDVTAGDNVSGSIIANDGIGGVYAGDNITSAAITADADGDNVGGVGWVVAGGGIGNAGVTVGITGANVGSVVSGGVVGDDIYADITSGGDLDAVNAGSANYFGAISASGVVFEPSLEITEGDVTTALSITSGPGVASVTISTLAVIDVEFTTSGLGGTDDTTAFEITTIDARTGADVDLLADVNTINVETGDIGSMSIEGDVESINVNTFAAPPRPSTPFASAGDIFVEGSLGTTTVEGDIGGILVGDNINGPTTATNGSIGDVAALNVNGDVTANIDVGSVTAVFDINGNVTATLGDIGDVTAGNDVNGDVLAAENISSVVAGNDVNGSVTATIGDIGVVHATDDVNGDVTAGGNIGIVSTGGQVGNDINGDINAGGDLDEVNAGLGALNGGVGAGAIVGTPVLIANDAIISFVISGTSDFYSLAAPAGGGLGIVLGVTDTTTDFAIITTDAGLSGAIDGDALLVTVASITTSSGTDVGSITIEGDLAGTISNIGSIGDIDDTADDPVLGIHVDDGIFIEGSILAGSVISVNDELEALVVGDIDDLTGSITSSSISAGGDIGLIQVGNSILGASTITSTGGDIREVSAGVDILGTSAAARTVISAYGSIGYVGAGNDIGFLGASDPGVDGILGSSDDFRAAGGQLDVLIIAGTGATPGPDGIPGTVDDNGIGDIGFIEADTDDDGFGAIAAAATTTIDGDRRTPTPQWISFRNDAGAGAAGLTGPGLYQTVAVGKGGDTADVTIAYGVVTEVELVQLRGGTIDLRTFITNETASGTRLDPFPNDPFGPANRLAKDPFRFKVGDAKHDPIDDQLRNDDYADLGDVFLAKDIRRGGKNKSRDLGEIIAEGDIRSIDNHIRDIKTIYADGSIGIVETGRDIKKGVTAGGEIGRIAAGRDIKKDITAGDDIGYRDPTEDFNGDVVFVGQEIADPGIHAGRKLKSPIESGGTIGAITADDTIKVGKGSLHAEGDINYIDGGHNIKGAIIAEGNIGTIVAQDYIRASIRAENGDIGRIESGEVMAKEIFAGGNIGVLRALDRSIRDVEARGNIGFIQSGNNIKNVIAGGDVGVVVAGRSINEVVAGGDIGFIDAGSRIRRVAAGGDIGMRPVPDDVPVAVPDGIAIRVGDAIDSISAGGNLLSDIIAGTAIGQISIGGDTLGDIIVGDTVIVPE